MTPFLTFIFIFFCGFYVFAVDAKCSSFLFSRQLGKRLRCSIYKTLTGVSQLNGHKTCVSELTCFSTNVYPNENVCELIKGTTNSLGIPDCIEWKNESEYNELLKTGSCSSPAGLSCELTGKIRKGTAGSYATTPAWDKLESMPSREYYFYSYWSNPFIFAMRAKSNGAFEFVGRKKSNHYSDMLVEGVKGQAVINKWTHIVYVWNRETKQATLYQDGKFYQTTPLNESKLDLPAPIRSVFDVGYKRDTGTVMMGWLRELLVFDRAVTSEDVNIIQDATLLDPRIWIGPPQSYLNMAPVSQPNTGCFSARAWGTYQWEEVPCDREMKFICKKAV